MTKMGEIVIVKPSISVADGYLPDESHPSKLQNSRIKITRNTLTALYLSKQLLFFIVVVQGSYKVEHLTVRTAGELASLRTLSQAKYVFTQIVDIPHLPAYFLTI